MKKNILVYHDSGLFYGSTEKLLQLYAKYLAKDFNVYFAYGTKAGEHRKSYLEGTGVTLVPFTFSYRKATEPFTIVDMQPSILDIIKRYSIHCIYTSVFSNFQFPMNVVPASIPFVLISPFGHFATNGNVVKTYVSGQSNLERLQKRGIKNVELLYNPLEDPAPEFLDKPAVGEVIVFGRVGRGDDSIFDPIAVQAFKKLETEYGEKVKYVVINAPPAWRELVASLGIRNMEYREKVSDEALQDFYREIDIFAHARIDGETVGMAIAEAMLAGNPIITHRSRFHNDHFTILDRDFAKWCDPDDSEQYFENMKWFVEHTGEIRAMGELARKKSWNVFSIDAQLPGIISTFSQATLHYRHGSVWGRVQGYVSLYVHIFLALPYVCAKKCWLFWQSVKHSYVRAKS